MTHNAYETAIERAVVVGVETYDWNCQQHITARFTVEDLQPVFASMRDRLGVLQAENARIRRQLHGAAGG